jgi:hypothetical protein
VEAGQLERVTLAHRATTPGAARRRLTGRWPLFFCPLDMGQILSHSWGMTPSRTNVAHAVRLAEWRRGVTAIELSEAAGCSLKSAQRTLAGLVRDGILTVTVPPRKGKRLGDWRNVYRTLKGGNRP